MIHGFHLGHAFAYKFFLEAMRVKKPYVISPIYFPRQDMPLAYRVEILAEAEAVLYLSEGEIKTVDETVGVNALKEKQFIVPNGINPIFGKEGKLYSHPNARDEEYVLCVGRLDERKNQHRLAQACRNLNVPLLLVGEAADPKVVAQVQAIADNWDGLWWENTAPAEALAECYRGAKVLACPSTHEIWPNVVAEGGMSGCNLVVSEESSTFSDLDGVWACKPKLESIEDAVGKAYYAPRDHAGLREYFKQFTWEKSALQLKEIYEVVA